MLNKVKTLINKYGLFEGYNDVTVAISGGADSVCLLYLLNEIKDEFSINLSAIHINHQLRGSESDRDQEFVKNLCLKLGVPLKVFKIDVKAHAEKTKESIELAARNMRYELFKEHSNGLVATAHNAGDNLETVLLNMARGTGIKGISGIPVKRDIYIRPLISCTREEIENFLSERKVNFVVDSSNLTDDYSRNLLRHKTVPTLKELNPSFEQTVFNMTENLKEDADFIENIAYKQYLLCSKSDRLDAELLKVQHKAIIKRVLAFYFLDKLAFSPDSIHIGRMLDVLLFGGKKSLPKNNFCENKDGFFIISREDNIKSEQIFDVELKSISKINNLFLNNTIDCDKINGSLVVRNRLGGDKIKLKGRNTKTLKKLFCEIKLDPKIRDIVPVISDDTGVVWAYGAGVDSRACADKNTKNAILVCVNTAVDTDSLERKNKNEKEFA